MANGLIDPGSLSGARSVGVLVIHTMGLMHPEMPLSPPDSFWPSPDVKAAFDRPFTVDRTHTIPYIGGYSKDGGTIYLDKRFPKAMTLGDRKMDPTPFVILHERVEKAFLDTKDQKYQTAHSDYATKAEHGALKQAGFSPADIRSYDAQMNVLAQKIAQGPNNDVPADLDTMPYADTDDMAAVAK